MTVHINAGELDQVITLRERDNTVVDALGQPAGPWVNVYTDIAARVDTRQGADGFAAGRDQASIQATFRIRYRDTVHARMQVVWRGQFFDIVGQPINVRGAGIALDLQCVGGLKDDR